MLNIKNPFGLTSTQDNVHPNSSNGLSDGKQTTDTMILTIYFHWNKHSNISTIYIQSGKSDSYKAHLKCLKRHQEGILHR